MIMVEFTDKSEEIIVRQTYGVNTVEKNYSFRPVKNWQHLSRCLAQIESIDGWMNPNVDRWKIKCTYLHI